MIKNIKDPVRDYIRDGGYDSPHNARITWEDHARQASEWEGTMFGKPSTFIGAEEFGNGEMKPREIRDPGTCRRRLRRCGTGLWRESEA